MSSTKDIINMLKNGSDKIRVDTHYQERTKRTDTLDKKIINLYPLKYPISNVIANLKSFFEREYYKSFRWLPVFTDSRQYVLYLQVKRNGLRYRISNTVVQVYTINWDTDEGIEEYIFDSTHGMSKEDFFNLSLITEVHDIVIDENVKKIRKVLKNKKRNAVYNYHYYDISHKHKPRLKRKKA